MENPYASPVADPEPDRVSSSMAGGRATGAIVAAVRAVAILLFLQGLGECAIGLVLVYFWKISLGAIAVILLVFSLGGLKIIAGLRNYRYRNRALGIVALIVAPLSLFTYLCLPSALILMVFGLVVYLNGDVKRAFAAAGRPE